MVRRELQSRREVSTKGKLATSVDEAIEPRGPVIAKPSEDSISQRMGDGKRESKQQC